MHFLENSYYKLIIVVNNADLTFVCKIISDDEEYVKFLDKYGKILTFRKDRIIFHEEIDKIKIAGDTDV